MFWNKIFFLILSLSFIIIAGCKSTKENSNVISSPKRTRLKINSNNIQKKNNETLLRQFSSKEKEILSCLKINSRNNQELKYALNFFKDIKEINGEIITNNEINISPEQIKKILKKTNSKTILAFCNLKEINTKEAIILASLKKKSLFLNALTSLSEESAKAYQILKCYFFLLMV